MTNDDKEALLEVLLGARNFILIVALLFLVVFALNGAANWLEAQSTPSNKRFEVVDTYKGCDVVRWSYGNLAEYKYFLHCNNTRPVYEK